jgi:RHS repeat-associated protein
LNLQFNTATGARLRKTVSTQKTTAGSVTDYCGNFIYADNQLITIFAGDVRVAPVNVGNSVYWKYEYSMKDHTSTHFGSAQCQSLSTGLGNIRVVFAAHSHGQPELLQQTSYYPGACPEQFGRMTMQQQNLYSQNATENKYLYNSKELQDDQLAGNTLDWYDYGARFYDATLGRWHVVDPLGEAFSSFSAYHYVRNNPIRLYDPNGMADNDWIERQQAMDNEYIAQHDAMFNSIMTGRSPHGNNKKKRNAGAEEQIDDGEDGEDASTGGGSDLNGNGVLRNTGDALSYGAGAIGITQIGMIQYRSSLSIHSKVGTFSSFASKYGTLGKVGGRLGYAGAGINLISNVGEVRSGEIGAGRFSYRLGSLGASICIGAAIGGPWAAVGGAAVGGISTGFEYIYDNMLVPLGNEIQYQIWNFENAIKNGWYPGR